MPCLLAALKTWRLLVLCLGVSVFTILSSCSPKLTIPPCAGKAVHSPIARQQLTTLTDSAWISGNKVTPLHNGETFYPAMLKSIRAAQHSITFETFAFVSSPISYQFATAMAKKADEGIPVHIILDAIGSKDAGPCLTILKNSAAQVKLYHRIFRTSPLKVNQRDHRKLLIIDGHTVYTGGAGFAHSWEGNGRTAGQWRDSQFRLLGPSVQQWQNAFTQQWFSMTGQTLTGPAYFPTPQRVGHQHVQTIMDSPHTKPSPSGSAILYMIRAAKHRIDIQQSYFVPTPQLIEALCDAAERGVKIRILTPSDNIDFPLCRTACRLLSKPLLVSGIELFEYQPSMMHAKIILVDNHLAVLGSGNLDPRSFFINFESNLHVVDKDLVQSLRYQFNKDLTYSKPIPLHDTGWSLLKTPQQSLAWLIRSQL